LDYLENVCDIFCDPYTDVIQGVIKENASQSLALATENFITVFGAYKTIEESPSTLQLNNSI